MRTDESKKDEVQAGNAEVVIQDGLNKPEDVKTEPDNDDAVAEPESEHADVGIPQSNSHPNQMSHTMIRFTKSIGSLITGDWSITLNINVVGHDCLGVTASPKPGTDTFKKVNGQPVILKASIRDCNYDDDILAVMGCTAEEIFERIKGMLESDDEEEKQIEG